MMENPNTLAKIKDRDEPKPCRQIWNRIREQHLLSIAIFCSILTGVIVGINLNLYKPRWTHREILFLEWPINIGGSLPKLFLVPLMMSGALASTGSSQYALTRSILLKIIPLFITLLYLASCLGIIVALIIRPGVYSKPVEFRYPGFEIDTVLFHDNVLDLFRNFFPPNVIQAVLQHYRTIATNVTRNNRTVGINVPTPSWEKGINSAGIIFFFTTAGIAVERLGPSGRPVLSLCQSMVQVCTAVSHWLVWLLPMYIVSDWACFFVAFRIAAWKGWLHSVPLAFAAFLYSGVIVPVIFYLITRRSPLKFMFNMLPAILNGFATASSLLTLPITFWCLDSNRLNPRISRLVILVGLVMNLGGYAILKTYSLMFAAQFRKKPITFVRVLRTSFSTFTAHTFLGAPYGSLAIAPQTYALDLFGLKIPGVTFLIPMDWLGDHITTPASILSTALVAGMMNHIFQKQLAQLPPYNQVLREGLLLKRLSQFATEEPEPEPFEPEEDVEPEQHIRRHSILSEDIRIDVSGTSGTDASDKSQEGGRNSFGGSARGSDASAKSQGSGRDSFGWSARASDASAKSQGGGRESFGGSARGSDASATSQGSGRDSFGESARGSLGSDGGSGSGRMSLDSSISSGPEEILEQDVKSAGSNGADTVGDSKVSGTAEGVANPPGKLKRLGQRLTGKGTKKKAKTKATKKSKKTSKGKK